MRARFVTGLVLLLAAAMTVGVQAADSYTPPTTDAFVKGIRGYPFVANAARREKLRAGVPKLKKCMPSTEVRGLIGDPDFGHVGYKSGPAGRIPAKILWTYVLEKKAALETEAASRVVIWFDTDSKLQGVTVHGAPDVEAMVSRREQVCT
jgi:hypothetical protein